eukprot:TCONS_00017413-protein
MLRFNHIRCLKQSVQISGWYAAVRASTQCVTDAEKMIQKVLETNSNHPEWKNITKDRKLLPMIANNLSSMGRFEELDQLFDKVGIDSCSLGMQTTLLRSYIERQNWESAFGLLKNLEGKLKHTRIHHELVQNLCIYSDVQKVFHHFGMLVDKESCFKFKRSQNTAQETFQAILQFLMENEHAISEKMLTSLIQFMHIADISVDLIALENLHKLFLSLEYECKLSKIEELELLDEIKESHSKDEKSFVTELKVGIEKKLIENGGHSFLENLKVMKKEAYIIDVANVLYYQSEKQSGPNILRLKNIVSSLVSLNQHKKRSKSVIFVVPRGGSGRKLHLVNYLHHLKQEFIMTCSIDLISNQKVDDDLLIMYLALQSPNKSVVISNDNFTEHLALISESKRSDMITWLRSTVKDFSGNGTIQLSNYIPSVMVNNGRLCIISDNNVLYIKKS